MDDKAKIEELVGLVRFLTNRYLTSDISWDRKWVCGLVREVEKKVGFQFIPPPMTDEERKEVGRRVGRISGAFLDYVSDSVGKESLE